MIAFAAIAPHGDVDATPELRAAMEEPRRADLLRHGRGNRHVGIRSSDTNHRTMVAAAAILVAATISATANPVVAARDGQVRVSVFSLSASAASVHLNGGIASGGRWFGWVPLRDAGGGSWWTMLRAPGYLGVYPIVVRADGVAHATDEVVSVLPRRWANQPGFALPEQVAQWWTRQAPPGAILKSIAAWRSGFFTHRDPTLNRLLRVRFTLLGDWRAKHLKRGPHELFFSVARLKPDGRWRLLETATAP